MFPARPISLSKYFDLSSEHTGAQVFWISTFAILTAVGAQIEIPHLPVPYTLQTFFVLLAGAALGKRNSFLSMSLYLSLGAIGLPVFSAGGFGFARILGPTGGYLVAFPFAAFAIGYLLNRMPFQRESEKERGGIVRYLWSAISMGVGLLMIFSLGTIQLNFVYFHDWSAAFSSGFLIFSWWDMLKLAAAVVVYRQLAHKLH